MDSMMCMFKIEFISFRLCSEVPNLRHIRTIHKRGLSQSERLTITQKYLYIFRFHDPYTRPFSHAFTVGMEDRAGQIKGGGAIQKDKERKRRKSNTESRRENGLSKGKQEDSAVLKKEQREHVQNTQLGHTTQRQDQRHSRDASRTSK